MMARPKAGTTVEDRYFAKIAMGPNGCWIWTGNPRGVYGHFRVAGRVVPVHRWAYEHFIAPIPDGLEPDHTCAVRKCVRPDHLEPKTHQENIRAHWREQRAICRNGHLISEETTYVGYNGGRWCGVCERERADRRNAALRAERSRNGAGPTNANKTECTHGHPFSEENTHWRSGGTRECKTCWRERARRYSGKVVA